jgi:hypothetical protein
MDTPEENSEISILEKQLAPFLRQNPYSKVERSGESYYVATPWKDESISFILTPELKSDLIATLNNVILPPRFTALYHVDSNEMEYIYTLLEKDNPYTSRQFEFTIEEQTYSCRFGDASDRLLLLSKVFRPTGEEPSAEYRNLTLLHTYVNPEPMQTLKFVKELIADRKPVSFFVTGFEKFDEGTILEVSKHLNLFMRYYDRKSPFILIHSAESGMPELPTQLQFVETTFPDRISTRRQDPFLLDLALAAINVETRLQFLYYYQILEYAAFYYISEDIKESLLKIIQTPDIHSNPDKYIPRILETISESRIEEEVKIDKTVKACCSPDIIWEELQQNLPYFCNKQEFEGGFVFEPFFPEDTTLENFCKLWHPQMSITLRHIRHALVHARERRSGQVIVPTRDNNIKLAPWVSLIRRIAEQVIIFGRST